MDTPPFDVELFINEVKRHPVLWDSKHPNFNHRQGKTSAWEDVAINLYPDSENWSNYDKFGKVRDIQKRWKNMRDTYVKEIRYEKKVQQGLAVAKRKRYVYAHLLEFLSPHSPQRKPQSKSSSEKSSSEDDDEEEEMEEAGTRVKSSDGYMLVDEGYSSSHVNQFCKATLGTQNHPEGVVDNSQTSSPESQRSKPARRTNSESTNTFLNYSQQYSLRSVSDAQSRTPPHHPQHSNPSASRVVASTDANSDTTSTPLEQDDDKMFLLSLLPYFKKFEEDRKLQARISFTKLLHDMLYKQS